MSIAKIREEFASRRQKFFQQLGQNSIAVLFNSSICLRSNDTEYPFRPSSDFYYLTGFEEPGAVAIFISQPNTKDYFLFSLPRDPEKERWLGKRFEPEEVRQNYGANQVFSIETLHETLVSFFTGKESVFYAFDDLNATKIIQSIFEKMPRNPRERSQIPQRFENLSPIIRELRLFKSEYEIELLRKAAQISVRGHQQAMKICRPGIFEYQLEAELAYTFAQQGARFLAYQSIIGGGNNACTLHYCDNTALLKEGDLVLVDAGAEYSYYASDVTRTFPVSGKFTAPQRAIYEIVLAAQKAAISAIKPGQTWDHIQNITARSITEGLVALNLLKGSVDDLIEQKAYRLFYLHNFGHWLGLDTHDPSEYQKNGHWRVFEPTMVLTVEPGIYIPQDYEMVEPIWRGIGVRIEDDVLVTDKGADILSSGLAKSAEEIEALMAESKTSHRHN